MKKHFIATACLCLLSGLTAMSDTPLWLRNSAISPDGTAVAFTYKGDIYIVPTTGGQARQLTTNSGYDTAPVWTPDGRSIAFSSTRANRSADIFVMPAAGGTSRRVTTSPNAETPLTFLNDSILLFATSDAGSPTAIVPPQVAQTYTVNVNNPQRPHLFAHTAMTSASAAADGSIVYQDRKGYEDVLRKHEHSSGTADIWTLDNGKYTKLTSFNGQDQCPVWLSPQSIAFLSEQDGTLNVWSMNVDGTQQKQLTHFVNHPVRSLSHANDGTLAFSWNGELYTLAPNGEPQKIDVRIVADDYDADLVRNLLSSGATTVAPSPNGEEVAFVLRGDVYVTSAKYKTTRRITDTPAQERRVGFSPDGKTLVYDSERDGSWRLFTATYGKDDKSFAYATDIVEKPLYTASDNKPAQQPSFSPDGKKVAFLENRTALRVLDMASGNVNTALDGKYNYSYSDGDIPFEWSPDSRWLLTSYIGEGGWNNTDIALVKADGSEVIDLTESGYSDGNPRWAMDGRAITYETGRYGMRNHGSWGEQTDVVAMFLDGDAWDEFNRTQEEADLAKKADKDKKDADKDADKDSKNKNDKKNKKDATKKDDVKPLVFDIDNRHHRTARLTASSSSVGDYILSNDGGKLYYTAPATEGKRHLFERNLRSGETKLLTQNVSGSIMPDQKMENIFVSGSGISKISLADGKKEAVEFEAPYNRHPSLEREYIFNHMAQQVRDKFYDTNLHGVDWDMYVENYRRFLPYINNNYDFAALLSEILGELNASHTGGRYYAPAAEMPSAVLGAFYDESYDGVGLRIAEVISGGPLADKKASVVAGDIITAIDGVEIAPNADYNVLLEGKAGRPVRLSVTRASGKNDVITVKPVSRGAQTNLLYRRWVERNEKYVDSISGGRVAYVHVKGMDSPSFREVYSRLFGKYRNHDAVVVDTRWNGGGWLHNDIALLLGGHEYVRYTPRGQYIGSDPFSQWTKPSAMLVNESNYSDAHGTPYVYQTLKIGPVVGAPVPGTMTAVWWETQIDPSLVFGIPEVTSIGAAGKILENLQLNPDKEVYNNPGDVAAGRDAQLEAAVRMLMPTPPSR